MPSLFKPGYVLYIYIADQYSRNFSIHAWHVNKKKTLQETGQNALSTF